MDSNTLRFSMYNNIVLFSFFSLIIFFSCNDSRDLSIHQKIERAIEIGEKDPQEALLILDSINNSQSQQLDERNFMLYQIAVVRAKRNMNEYITPNQTELIGKSADYFEKHRDLKNAWFGYFYLARAYRSQSNLEEELTHYLKAEAYAEALNDSVMMGKTLYNIGMMYAEQGVYDSTRVYLQKVVVLLDNYPCYQLKAFRLLAFNYYQENDLDLVLKYLDKGIPLLQVQDNEKFAYLYNILYGVVYKNTNQLDKALDYFLKNMTDVNIPEIEKVRTAINLAEVYLKSNKMDSATYFVQYVEPKLCKIDDDDELLLFGYDVLLSYYLEIENKMKISEYNALFNQVQTVIKIKNQSETLFFVDQKKKKIDQLESATEKYQTEMYLIYFITIVVGVVLVVMLIRFRIKKKDVISWQREEIEKLSEGVEKVLSNKSRKGINEK